MSTVLPVDSDDHCSAEDATASEADERPECLIVAEPDGLLHAVCLVCRFDRERPDGAEADARLRRPVLEPTRERQTAPQGRGRALCAREQLDGRQEGLQPGAGAECRLRCVVVNELVTDDTPRPRERGCGVGTVVRPPSLEPIVDPAGVGCDPKAARHPAEVPGRHHGRVEAGTNLLRLRRW